jgi:hypothetical protein
MICPTNNSHLIIGSEPGAVIPENDYASVTFINGSIHYRKLFPFLNDIKTYHIIASGSLKYLDIQKAVKMSSVDQLIIVGGCSNQEIIKRLWSLDYSYQDILFINSHDRKQIMTGLFDWYDIVDLPKGQERKQSNGVFACAYRVSLGNVPIAVHGVGAFSQIVNGVRHRTHIHNFNRIFVKSHDFMDNLVLSDMIKYQMIIDPRIVIC